MSRKKGDAEAVRQNFSMHPDLARAVIDAANHFNAERTYDITQDRGLRITYSKVAALLVWKLKRDYLTPDGQLTYELRRLMAEYEASVYEMTDSPDADAILRQRQRRLQELIEGQAGGVVDSLPLTYDFDGEEDRTDL